MQTATPWLTERHGYDPTCWRVAASVISVTIVPCGALDDLTAVRRRVPGFTLFRSLGLAFGLPVHLLTNGGRCSVIPKRLVSRPCRSFSTFPRVMPARVSYASVTPHGVTVSSLTASVVRSSLAELPSLIVVRTVSSPVKVTSSWQVPLRAPFMSTVRCDLRRDNVRVSNPLAQSVGFEPVSSQPSEDDHYAPGHTRCRDSLEQRVICLSATRKSEAQRS